MAHSQSFNVQGNLQKKRKLAELPVLFPSAVIYPKHTAHEKDWPAKPLQHPDISAR